MTVESEMSLFRQHQTLAELPHNEEEASEPQMLPETSQSEERSAEEPLTVDNASQDAIPAALELEDVAEDLTPSELALFQVETESAVDAENSETNLEQQEAVLEPSPRFKRSADVAGAPLPSETAENDPHVSKLDPAIEDYLDSSTALRQHLEDAVAEPETPPETNNNPFTPKKIMFLLGGSIVGAFIVVLFLNITGLRNQLWPPKQPRPSAQVPASSPSQASSSPTVKPRESPTATTSPPGPDLSKKEFSDVNLENLSRLEPKPSASPSPSSPAASPTPKPPKPTSETPKPSVTLSQEPAPILKNQTSETGLFYVVIPYNNAASLQKTQQLVPTAFLTNGTGGQQVQAGALESMEAAKRLAKRLRSKGLSAAIIAPN
ncbi:SPOR domain-containing protein [Acaryochloris marina NIES-2412]|uniref:SPOR domain-containing protein n=1 Tax=Acaryochloris marina TaxID=155978 RepID=UPI0040592520